MSLSPRLLQGVSIWVINRVVLCRPVYRVKGQRGKKVQELLFDELWRETKRQMRSIQVKSHLFNEGRRDPNAAVSTQQFWV